MLLYTKECLFRNLTGRIKRLIKVNKIRGRISQYLDLLCQSNVFLSLIMNALFLGIGLICFDLKYEVSDDFVMASVMSGAYGETQNPQMMFVNVIIGYILLPFYKIFPDISWYFVGQIFLIFISSSTVTWLLLEKLERAKAVMLSVILILVFTNDAYILVQFTKTSMFAVMAGSLVFLWELYRERKKIPLLFGAGLCLLGTMIRFPTIYLAGTFLVFIIVYETIGFWGRMKSSDIGSMQKKKTFIIITLSGLLLIASVYGMQKLNWYTYNNDEEYGFFSAYSNARSGIVDQAIPEYQTCEEELKKIGISENDYLMLKSWGFTDNDYFTIEKIQQIIKIVRKYDTNQKVTFEQVLERTQNRGIQKYPVCLACILILFFGVFLNPRKWWLSIGSLLLGSGYLFYFSYRGRSIYRIEYCIFLGVFLSMIYFWERTSDLGTTVNLRKTCTGIIMLFLLGNVLTYIPDFSYKNVISETRRDYINSKFWYSSDYNPGKYRRVVNKDKPTNHLLEEIEKNTDNYYFLDFNTTIQTLYYEYSPWKALPVGYYSSFSYLSGITTNFPDCIHRLEERGISNQMKSLVTDNVYLVDNYNLEIKLNYLREHYYPEARAELYKVLDGYYVWKIYEK